MAELKPCPKCGKIPEHRLFMKDIPEADRLYPAASLRCDCKAVQTVALTHKEALEFAEEIWNEKVVNNNG